MVLMQASTTLDTTANTDEIDGLLSGVGTLTDTGNGTLILTGNNGFAGALKINSGTVVAASGGNLGNSSSTNRLVFNGGALLMTGTYSSSRDVILSQTGTIDTNGNIGTISGTISSSGGLTKQGAGTLSLTGVNPFTGLVNVNGGAVDVNTDAALGGGNGTASVLSSSTLSTAVSISAIPSGFTVGSNFLGSSVQSIGGSTGNFTVTLAGNANTTLNNGSASFATALPVTLNGGALVQIGTFSLAESNSITGIPSASMNRNIILGAGGGTYSTGSNNGTIAGVISGSGNFTKSGSGTLVLGGVNTYTGSTSLNAGTTQISTNENLGDDSNTLIFTGGALRLGAAISPPVTRPIQTASSGTIDTNGFNVTIPVGISGSGSLSKSGTGTLTYAGNNTYSGGTTVTAGELIANKLSNGTLTVTGGLAQVTAKGTPNSVAGTTVVPAVSITGGQLDLTNNALIVDYATLGTQLSDIRGNLLASQIISSTATSGLAIAYADASAIGRTTFGGVALADTTNIVVGLTTKGDANFDGVVNALDFNAVATNFGVSSDSVWTQGDFNYDGVVDTSDFIALSQNFGTTVAAPTPVLLGSLVPEPTSLAALALLGLVGRRRRRA